MRFDGTLAKWNDDRGFGFIAPAEGGQEIFVHISSFPRDGQRPRLDEPLSFEIELNKDGKKRAFNLRRPSRCPPHVRHGAAGFPRETHSRFGNAVVIVAVLIALGVFGYSEYSRRSSVYSPVPGVAPHVLCDGRTYCSQMTSCTEAKFFLRNCPDTQMDGNHDGVPCEQQWCTSWFAK